MLLQTVHQDEGDATPLLLVPGPSKEQGKERTEYPGGAR